MFEPWETIAGCSLGTRTQREILIDLIKVAEKCEKESWPMIAQGLVAPSEEVNHWLRQLAQYSDEYFEHEMHEMAEDIVELIGSYLDLLPAYCSVLLNNGEWTITPYIDHELPRFESTPDEYVDDHVYVVNDHGNVSCMQWENEIKEYNCVWSMV